jgi:hypothetical protein
MRSAWRLLWAVLVCLGLQGSALAASGTALGVETDARAEGSTSRTLTVGADIFIGDRVITDARGLVQIRFSDDTELVVGPNSSLVLEDYLLRNDGSAGKFALNALAGTFRFVTGSANHDDYAIKTPTGTLAVRGTAFDLFVAAGLTRVLMYSGTTILCSQANSCVTVASQCGVGESDDQDAQDTGQAQNTSGTERDDLRDSFPFADNQGGLLKEFQLDQVPACRLSGPTAPAPAALADVVGACDPVIGEQYAGDKQRWGVCGGNVAAYIATLGQPPSPDALAELVTALAELYRPGDLCLDNPTELPQAIRLLAGYITDPDQRDAILEIAQTIEDCDVAETSALDAVPSSV